MALNPVTELEALIDALDADGVEYALCGGLALGIHGHPRATKDIDLLVTAAAVDAALATARRVGFDVPARRMTFGLRTGRPRDVHRVSKLDVSTGDLLPLDLLVVNDDLAEVWATRLTIDTGARSLIVVSRAGLATMKKLAGRGQDLVDVAKLEAAPTMKNDAVDMSPAAIAKRIEEMRALCDLMAYLGRLTPLVEAAERVAAAKKP